MSDAPTAEPLPHRLERPLDGRVVTGVCAGLARHFDVDVTLVRIVVVVLAFLGGAGVILYVAATLLVPEQGQEQPLLRASSRRGRAQLLLGAALVAIGAGNVLGDVGVGFHGHALWGSVMLAIGAFFLLRIQEGRPSFGPRGSAPSTDETADGAITESAPPTARRSSRAATLIALGSVLVAAAAAIAVVLTLADASWETAAGAAVVAAGLALAGGSLIGASPLLIAPLLAATAGALALQASDVDLRGGIGTRSYRPATAADVRQSYRLGIGELDVDLRDTALPRGRTVIRAKLGIGDLVVRAPRNTAVQVRGHAGAGELRLLGGNQHGTGVDDSAARRGPRTRLVVIDARVGFGAIEVVDAGSAFPNHDHDWSRR